MSLKTALAITRFLVMGTPIVWILWDVYAYINFSNQATESHFIWTIYQHHHWFALVVGLAAVALYWHFFLA